jgi:hypothetical protein
MDENAVAQVVDLELAERTSDEIACAYRALCAAVLLRTAVVTKARSRPRKVELDQKRTAAQWAEAGRQGILSFDQCCEAVGYDPDRTRQQILRHAAMAGVAPINTNGERKQARSRMVFGRKLYVRSRSSSAVHGMAAGNPDASAHRGGKAWS